MSNQTSETQKDLGGRQLAASSVRRYASKHAKDAIDRLAGIAHQQADAGAAIAASVAILKLATSEQP